MAPNHDPYLVTPSSRRGNLPPGFPRFSSFLTFCSNANYSSFKVHKMLWDEADETEGEDAGPRRSKKRATNVLPHPSLVPSSFRVSPLPSFLASSFTLLIAKLLLQAKIRLKVALALYRLTPPFSSAPLPLTPPVPLKPPPLFLEVPMS